MSNPLPTRTDLARVRILLAVFILLMAAWDWASITYLRDTILPPTLDASRNWAALGDWSAVNVYEADWKISILRLLDRYLRDEALVAIIVLGVHALLWTGIYFAGLMLWAGSPWTALAGVFMARLAPDLFGVDLLSAASPARATAIALAFWSIGFAIRRRWVSTCLVAGLIAHFSPTVAFWFAQFLIMTIACLNYEWGWKRSFFGAVVFLAVAGGPLVRFLFYEVAPEPPLPAEAMLGLHFFANPRLMPFATPLWAWVCFSVYLAMSFVWLKHYFLRRTAPVAVIFFLIGFAGTLLEIIFVGLVPVERAARFELHILRAYWFLWIAICHAPAVEQRMTRAWESGVAWRPIFDALVFSQPVAYSAIALIERLRRPPRWKAPIVVAMLGLLVLTAFVFPHASIGVGSELYALALGLLAVIAAPVAMIACRNFWSMRLAGSMVGALILFVAVFGLLDGRTALRTIATTHRIAAEHRDWTTALHWIRTRAPRDSKWAVASRPREFRRRTGRAVLVNRNEVPRRPDERFEWFQHYAETHGWTGPFNLSAAALLNREQQIQDFRAYRLSFFLGVAERVKASKDWVVLSRPLISTHGTNYILLHEGDRVLKRLRNDPNISLKEIHREGPFRIILLAMEFVARELE